MTRDVKPIPAGYHAVTPYLVVNGAAKALEFYKQVFGAVETLRMSEGNRIGHAEMLIGDSHVMLADERPEMNYLGPRKGKPPPVGLLVYVEDVDAVVERAVQAGAVLERPVQDQFYGDRTGGIIDPFGHRWYVATHVEDIAPDELERRAKAAQK